MYNEGISRTGSVIDLGLEHKILEKRGSWISYNGNLIGQGREAAKQYLAENDAVSAELTKLIYDKVAGAGGIAGGMALGESEENRGSEEDAAPIDSE